jgi:hypothetical protein
MSKILITDLDNYRKIDLNKYEKVKVLVFSDFKGRIDDLKNKNCDFKIDFVSSEYYYNKIYEEMGYYIKRKIKNNFLLLAHYKLISMKLYDLFFCKIIIEEVGKSNVVLKTKFDYEINELFDNSDLKFFSKPKRNFKFFFKNLIYVFIFFIKSIYGLTIGVFSKKERSDILFIDYYKKNVVKYYFNYFKNYKFKDINAKFKLKNYKLDFKIFILMYKQFFSLIKSTYGYSFLSNNLYISLNNILEYALLVSRYDIKLIIGAVDGNFGYDFLYLYSKNKIKLICLSHQTHVYPFRVYYLSNPFDYYFTSSKYLTEIIKRSQHFDTGCKFINIGYCNYNSEEFKKIQNIEIEKKYDIIYVCDYYHDSFAINPFSKDLTYKIAALLLKLSKKYKILVRPRSKDKYYEDMYSVLGNNVDYSLGNDRPSIYEDIKSARLGIAAYTNGIKDGLLMKIPFIHLNFINLYTTYMDMAAEKNGLYLALNETDAIRLVVDFFNKKLKSINFDKLNKKYIDNGEYQINKALEVIKKELKIENN